MIKSNYSKEQRLAYVIECRRSGLTDTVWCQQQGIPVGTFYNWVKRFRQEGFYIPEASGKSTMPIKQDVVKLDFDDTSYTFSQSDAISTNIYDNDDYNAPSDVTATIELNIWGANLKFTDNINPAVLGKTLHLIKELSC